MCWPGPHCQNCEERGKHTNPHFEERSDRGSDKLQTAIFYCIDADQVRKVELGSTRWLCLSVQLTKKNSNWEQALDLFPG